VWRSGERTLAASGICLQSSSRAVQRFVELTDMIAIASSGSTDRSKIALVGEATVRSITAGVDFWGSHSYSV
jgi:hypothetical protein